MLTPPAACARGPRLLLLAFTVSVLTAACTSVPEPPLRIGTSPWPGLEPLFLGRELGLLQDSEVRLVEYTSYEQVARAFRNDTIHGAVMTLDQVLDLQQGGYEPRVVAVIDISRGADALIGHPTIRTVAELKGRRVGMEMTPLSHYLLSRALESAGLSVRDINIVPTALAEHVEALKSHAVDAVVTYEPVNRKLLENGGRELFDSGDIAGEIVDVLAIRGDRLGVNAEKARKLLTGWFGAVEHLSKHPEESIRRMAPRLQTSEAGFAATLEGVHIPSRGECAALISGAPAPLEQTMNRLGSVMRAQGLLQGRAEEVRSILEASLIEGVRR